VVSGSDDDRTQSLRQFAATIQEKAGPVNDPVNAAPDMHSNPVTEDLASILRRQPLAVIAGVLIGVGVGMGYLLGNLTRRSKRER
jgi:hypothetical protein